jgi:hypothetical protein
LYSEWAIPVPPEVICRSPLFIVSTFFMLSLCVSSPPVKVVSERFCRYYWRMRCFGAILTDDVGEDLGFAMGMSREAGLGLSLSASTYRVMFATHGHSVLIDDSQTAKRLEGWIIVICKGESVECLPSSVCQAMPLILHQSHSPSTIHDLLLLWSPKAYTGTSSVRICLKLS